MPALQIIALDTTTPQLRAPSAADTYAAPRAMEITPVSLTGSSATSSLSIAQTWNTTGTPTAIDLNVTDTASNAASRLLDLRVGGSTRLNVDKTGAVVISDGTSALTIDSTNGATTFGQTPAIIMQTSNALIMRHGNSDALGVRAVSGASDPRLDFLNTSNAIQVRLTIDAANTLAQRNGTNAQGFNLYNTFTDASNYERSFRRYVSNALEIGHEAAGTGTGAREIRFISNGATRLSINTSGDTVVSLGRSLFLGASGVSWQQLDNQMRLNGGPLEMVERTAPASPATNAVRIYAEDNGAGKTRLMALFATGAAQQIAIEP